VIVWLAYLDDDGLVELMARNWEVVRHQMRFAKMMRGHSPPLCGGCDARLRRQPRLWVALVCEGAATLAGLCDDCVARDRDDLEQAIAAYAGIERFDPANVFNDGGRA
jgi:hypothetical protein